MLGFVSALDASSGTILWLMPAGGSQPLFTSLAFSPRVDRGLVIVLFGGHDQGARTAFDV